jgi:hypothetical protein
MSQSKKTIQISPEHAELLDLIVVLVKDVLEAWRDGIGKPSYDEHVDKTKLAEFNLARVRLVLAYSRLVKQHGALTPDLAAFTKLIEDIDTEGVIEFRFFEIAQGWDKAKPSE